MEDVTKKILNDYLAESTPQVDNPDQPKKALRLARAYHVLSDTILKLSDNRWYVDGDTSPLDLAEDLEQFSGIPAVGVIVGSKIVGIIVKKDLLNVMGRPFGRDVLSSENALTMAQPTKSFHLDSNIFAVSEELGKIQRGGEVRYFTLHTDTGAFAGVFSSQDLLHYLSETSYKDITLARAIQSRIVPELTQELNGQFECVVSSTASKDVGGDFYSVNNYASDRWCFTLCDVSGKGVVASLGCCALYGALSGFDLRRGLSALISHLNKFMIKTFDQEKFVTGIFLDYNSLSRTITLADLGHGFVYVYRQKKLLKIKTAERTYPLGISEDMIPDLFKYSLLPDDILLILTDGLVEQGNTEGDEYGLSRIRKVLDSYSHESLSSIRVHLLEDLHAFRKTIPIGDDISFLLLRPRGS